MTHSCAAGMHMGLAQQIQGAEQDLQINISNAAFRGLELNPGCRLRC